MDENVRHLGQTQLSPSYNFIRLFSHYCENPFVKNWLLIIASGHNIGIDPSGGEKRWKVTFCLKLYS
jgi:hypothetical protein